MTFTDTTRKQVYAIHLRQTGTTWILIRKGSLTKANAQGYMTVEDPFGHEMTIYRKDIWAVALVD